MQTAERPALQSLRSNLEHQGIRPLLAGDGRVAEAGNALCLSVGPQDGSRYSNAQLDDYHAENRFRHRPPVTLQLRARFSVPYSLFGGTAGFGFWNDPAGMSGRVRLAPPQAVWFFLASPHSRMPLVLDRPGWGWTAATLGVRLRDALWLAPLAPVLMLAARSPARAAHLWSWLKARLRLSGTPLCIDDLTDWHDYRLAWTATGAHFWIDGAPVAHAPHAPPGPLGLVIWIDNQYLVAEPTGELRSGSVACGAQSLEIAELHLERG